MQRILLVLLAIAVTLSPGHVVADLIFLAYLLLYFPLQALWRSYRPLPDRPEDTRLASYWRQALNVLLLLGVMWIVAWRGGYSLIELGLDLPLTTGGAWGLGIVCVLFAVLYLVHKHLQRKQTPEDLIAQEEKLKELPFQAPRTRTETIAYLASAILVCATWELLFRGYLLLVLIPVTGLWPAIALAAIAYGAGHGYKNPRQFFGSIAMAAGFTIAYALSGSLWWLIILHAAAPASVLLIVPKEK